MSVRKNNKNMARAFIGRKEIAKIYRGRRLVFERLDPTPYLLCALPAHKLLAQYDYAGKETPLLYTLTPDVQTYGAAVDFNASFTLRFNFTPQKDVYGPVLEFAHALRLRAAPTGLILENLRTKKKWLMPPALFTQAENRVEIARDTSLKAKTTGVFINGRFYALKAMTADFAPPRGAGRKYTDRVLNAEFYPAVNLYPGSIWPTVTTLTIGNLVPETITRGNMQGFGVEDTLRETDPLNAFNPAINASYPRWQASAPEAYFILTLPQGKRGNVWRYKVTQWYDSGFASRRCIAWRLEGSLDGITFDTVHEVLENPWSADVRGLELTFEPKNKTDYRYLKFTMIDNEQGGSYCSVGQIRFWTEDPDGDEEVYTGD